MIIFNENVVQWLSLVKGLDASHIPGTIPPRLLLIYFGMCSIAAGAVIYSRFCPGEVKQYQNAESYTGDAVNNVPMIVRKGYEREIITGPYKTELEALNGGSYTPEEKWRAFLYLYYEHRDHKHPLARIATFAAYTIGLVLLGIPSVEVFIKIIGISFGWTTSMVQ